MKPPREWIRRLYDEATRDEMIWRGIDGAIRDIYRAQTGKEAPEFGVMLLAERLQQ